MAEQGFPPPDKKVDWNKMRREAEDAEISDDPSLEDDRWMLQQPNLPSEVRKVIQERVSGVTSEPEEMSAQEEEPSQAPAEADTAMAAAMQRAQEKKANGPSTPKEEEKEASQQTTSDPKTISAAAWTGGGESLKSTPESNTQTEEMTPAEAKAKLRAQVNRYAAMQGASPGIVKNETPRPSPKQASEKLAAESVAEGLRRSLGARDAELDKKTDNLLGALVRGSSSGAKASITGMLGRLYGVARNPSAFLGVAWGGLKQVGLDAQKLGKKETWQSTGEKLNHYKEYLLNRDVALTDKIKSVGEAYKNMPPRYKALLTVALLGGTIATGGSGLAVGAMYSQRLLGGYAFAKDKQGARKSGSDDVYAGMSEQAKSAHFWAEALTYAFATSAVMHAVASELSSLDNSTHAAGGLTPSADSASISPAEAPIPYMPTGGEASHVDLGFSPSHTDFAHTSAAEQTPVGAHTSGGAEPVQAPTQETLDSAAHDSTVMEWKSLHPNQPFPGDAEAQEAIEHYYNRGAQTASPLTPETSAHEQVIPVPKPAPDAPPAVDAHEATGHSATQHTTHEASVQHTAHETAEYREYIDWREHTETQLLNKWQLSHPGQAMPSSEINTQLAEEWGKLHNGEPLPHPVSPSQPPVPVPRPEASHSPEPAQPTPTPPPAPPEAPPAEAPVPAPHTQPPLEPQQAAPIEATAPTPVEPASPEASAVPQSSSEPFFPPGSPESNALNTNPDHTRVPNPEALSSGTNSSEAAISAPIPPHSSLESSVSRTNAAHALEAGSNAFENPNGVVVDPDIVHGYTMPNGNLYAFGGKDSLLNLSAQDHVTANQSVFVDQSYSFFGIKFPRVIEYVFAGKGLPPIMVTHNDMSLLPDPDKFSSSVW